MSTNASMPASASVSKDWELVAGQDRPASLIVQLRRRTHLLSWYRFEYAEGDNEKVKLDFGEHTVTIRGQRLDVLLEDLAQQRVVRLIQPTENEAKFNVRGAGAVLQTGRPVITEILMDAK